MNGLPTISQRDDEINLRELIARLWTGKWWIVTSAFLLTLAFGLTAFLTTPIYRASTVLIPVSGDGIASGSQRAGLGSLAGVASMIGIGLDADASNTDEALAVLKSREFTYRFVQEKELLPVLFADAWNGESGRWRDPDGVPTLELAYKAFVGGILDVSEDTRTGLVTVSVDWRDREAAASWANELVEQLNAEMRSRALKRAEASLQYLKDELKLTNQVGIQEAINRLIETQINKRMLANVTKEYAFRVADRAMAPGKEDPLRPRKLLLVLLGFVLGSVLGALGVLIASVFRRRP